MALILEGLKKEGYELKLGKIQIVDSTLVSSVCSGKKREKS